MVRNRRKEQRKMLREPAEVAFYHNGALHWGSMVDLSKSGARFTARVGKGEKASVFPNGRKLDCCITMPAGTSKCKGTVQWVGRHGDNLEWGISFTELSSDDDDPLRAAILYYFSRKNERVSGMSA